MDRVLLAAAVAIGALLLGTPSASGEDDHVPVATDDAITLWAGSSEVLLDLLANDSDADGHRELAICRFGTPQPDDGLIEVEQESLEGRGKVEIDLDPRASGTYTVGYQACDYSYLVPATLTVTVRPVGVTTVTKVAEDPRKLRLTNPDQHEVWVYWGPPGWEMFAGYVSLPPGGSRVVTAGSRRVEWGAGFEDGDTVVYTGYGRVRGLEPAPVDHAAARVPSLFAPSRPPALHRSAGRTDPVEPTAVAPPVTGDETVTRWAGSMGYVDVLANDTDPQGQPLDVCRIAPSGRDVSGFVEEWNGRFRLDTSPRRSGTYSVTYYACNESRLAPGTVTVHLRRPRPVQVRPGSRAGFLRIANRNVDTVRVSFYDDRAADERRVVRVPARTVRHVRVPASFTRWHADIGTPAGYAGGGYWGD